MTNIEQRNYHQFFKEELYDGFVNFLINKLGNATVIAVLNDRPLVTKRGIHPQFTRHFNEFMHNNPRILQRFVDEGQKYMGLRNICDADLKFPVDVTNENLMLREKLRIPEVLPKYDERIPRPSKADKSNVKPMTGQILRGGSHQEKKYVCPKRLTVHFKEGYAKTIGKTTLSFMVNSRSEAMNIILDRFERKVAYATIQNEEEFVFVKPRNGKNKRSRKLRSKI